MSKIVKTMIMCMIGGNIYVGIEVLTRGYSHFSMFVCGGICFVWVGVTGKFILENSKRVYVAILAIMILGSMIITTLEFFTGVIVNLTFGLEVWDYSNMDYNVMGQICPVFSGLWALVSLPCVYINSVVRKWVFGEKIEYIE